MLIEIPRHDRVVLWGHYPELRDWRESLALPVPGAEYTKAAKRGGWDGMARPGKFRKIEGRWCLQMGRGFLDRVRASFPDAEVRVRPSLPGLPLDHDLPEGLRDYQSLALRLGRQRRWGRIAFATNAGKGAVIALAARNAAPGRVLILADEVAVFEALVGEVEKWAPDEDVARVEAGRKDPPGERVVIGMVKTLANRVDDSAWADWAEEFDVVMADEADLATAKTWRKVLRACVNSSYRLGFSGTFPALGSLDDRNLEETLGPVLARVGNETLVARGISARPEVRVVPYDTKLPRPPSGLRGPELRAWVYERAVVGNEERHRLVRASLLPDQPNVVLVNRLDHGHALAAEIPDSEFLQGSDSRDVRKDTMERFRAGEFGTLIATRILDRGTNLIGHARGLVFASGEGSARQVLQRLGRGLRKVEGKDRIYLTDIADRGHDYLREAAYRRVEVYRDEGFAIRVQEPTLTTEGVEL